MCIRDRPIVAAIAMLPVIRYDIKIVSQEARTLQEIDLPIDLDLFSFILIPNYWQKINTVS